MTNPQDTWAKLTDHSGKAPVILVLTFKDFHDDLKKYDITHPFFGPTFQRATDVVIRAALTGQGATAKALCHELSPFARAIADTPPGTSLDRLDMPNFASAAIFCLEEAMGWANAEPARTRIVLDRLSHIRQYSQNGRIASVVANLAFGRRDIALKLAVGQALDPFFAALLAPDAKAAADLWPGWRDDFPRRYAANADSWDQLLFAARFIADSPTGLADWLLAQIT